MRPLVVEDARRQEPFASLAVTADTNIGSYIGVPLVLTNGEVYGTLCAIDPDTHEFSPQDAELLIMLARFLAFQIERDQLLAEQLAVLDAATDAMALVSPDRRFRMVNRRFGELFGVDPEEVRGQAFSAFREQVERIFADPRAFTTRVAGTASDTVSQFSEVVQQVWPEQRELNLFSTPVRAEGGDYQGRLYVFRDITRERAVDRMKTEFVSMVSHELRTPLTSIKGYVDLLLDGEVGNLDEEQREFLEVVKKNADRLVALIGDLLDIARIEAGKVQLKRAPIDLRHLVDTIARSFRPQIESKRQTLTLEYAPLLPRVVGDEDRVTQILVNLLSNAHKYTLKGGAIHILVHPEEEAVRIAVRDSGVGLTPDEQARVFTKFFRAQNPATQHVGGTGLGLAITHQLVELHGGTMSLASTPGQGSTFSFTLPIADRDAMSGTEQPDGTSDAPPARRRILIVEDEPDIANLLHRYLERGGYEVYAARDAQQALALARTLAPDLITMDIALPDVDGLTALKWLKADHVTAHIPVVMLTVIPDTGEAKSLGGVDYLAKPVGEAALLDRVRRILSHNRTI